MNEKELFEKLADFFTVEQIRNIDAYALEMAVDAEIAPDDLETAHYIGREHICECFSYWERDEIEAAARYRVRQSSADTAAFPKKQNRRLTI